MDIDTNSIDAQDKKEPTKDDKKYVLEELGFQSGQGEKWESILEEKIGLKLIDLQTAISTWLKEHAEEVALSLPNIAPYADYSKMLEDNDSMTEFLRNEASKPENWKWQAIKDVQNNSMLEFVFKCLAVDDGDTVNGFVFINKSGKIRHAFAQA